MDTTDELVQRFERVTALDLGKTCLTACVRTPSVNAPGRRRQEIREYSTMSRSLLEMADWLRCEGVELVAMEATSSYWKPAFYLLEPEGFTCWLLNAKHVKNVPGRPKTDLLTELPGLCGGRYVRCRGALAKFPLHDQRRWCPAGAGRVGGAAGRVA
jgi:hypothetical protein